MLFHHQHCHGPFNPDPEPALVKQSDLHLKRVGWKIEPINKEIQKNTNKIYKKFKKIYTKIQYSCEKVTCIWEIGKWTYVQIRSTGLDKKYFWIFKKLETTDI